MPSLPSDDSSADDRDERDERDSRDRVPDDLPPDPFGPGDPPAADTERDLAGGDPTTAGLFGLLGPLFATMRQAGGADRMRRDVARQSAIATATGGTSESNPDPIERIRLSELTAIAAPHIVDVGGWAPSEAGAPVPVRALGRAEFAVELLDCYGPVFDGLANAMTQPPADGDDAGHLAAFGPLFELAGPTMLGAQAGGLVGELATRLLGGHDLPLPGPGTARGELVAVPANLRALIEEWSLPPDVVRIQFCLLGLAQLAVLRRPHVSDALRAHMTAFGTGHAPDAEGIVSRFEQLDPTDPSSMSGLLSDPASMLGVARTPAGDAAAAALNRIVVPLVGWVDHVVQQAGQRLLGGDSARADEAWRRRRIGTTAQAGVVTNVLGVRLDRSVFERGSAFVQGVVDRAGADGLFQLWADDSTLPTDAELDAPGLWLARLEG